MAESTNKSKNILKIIGNVLFYTVIVLLLVFSVANLSIKSNQDIANVFNRGFLPVLSDSMEGDNSDSFNKGSLVFVKLLSDTDKESLAVGDVVTFYDLGIGALNTHRIVYVSTDYVVTQGDKAAASAAYQIGGDNTGVQYETVTFDNIKAIYTGDVNGVGSVISYLQTPTGFAIFIILPVLLLLAYQGYVLTKTLLAVNRAKLEKEHELDKEQAKKDLEAEKEKIRQELLEEMKKEQK